MANLFDFPNMTTGPDNLLVGLATEIPILPVMILVFIWGFVVLTGSIAQGTKKGYVDLPIWTTLGFLLTDLIALIMSTQEGIINPLVLSVLVGLTFFSMLWLSLSRGRFEQ